jgi:hypothetical protein
MIPFAKHHMTNYFIIVGAGGPGMGRAAGRGIAPGGFGGPPVGLQVNFPQKDNGSVLSGRLK